MTILLTADHHVVRQGLCMLLEAQGDFRVVAEVGDGLEAVKLTEHFAPGVLIVDVMIPRLNGLEVTRQLGQPSPRTRDIMLSMYSNEAYVLEVLSNGAAWYVLKKSTATDLMRAVHEVAAGPRHLSPPLSEPAIEADLEKAQDTPFDLYETLATREREVLQLAAEGRTNADIAAARFMGHRLGGHHPSSAGVPHGHCHAWVSAGARDHGSWGS